MGVGQRVWRYRDPCPANRRSYGLGAQIKQSTSSHNQKGKITVASPNIAASVFHQRRAGKLAEASYRNTTYTVNAEVVVFAGSLLFASTPLLLPSRVPCHL